MRSELWGKSQNTYTPVQPCGPRYPSTDRLAKVKRRLPQQAVLHRSVLDRRRGEVE